MEPESIEKDRERRFVAVEFLRPHGFRHINGWRFFKNGKTYDLSAADLSQIERIEREGLFLVGEWSHLESIQGITTQ